MQQFLFQRPASRELGWHAVRLTSCFVFSRRPLGLVDAQAVLVVKCLLSSSQQAGPKQAPSKGQQFPILPSCILSSCVTCNTRVVDIWNRQKIDFGFSSQQLHAKCPLPAKARRAELSLGSIFLNRKLAPLMLTQNLILELSRDLATALQGTRIAQWGAPGPLWHWRVSKHTPDFSSSLQKNGGLRGGVFPYFPNFICKLPTFERVHVANCAFSSWVNQGRGVCLTSNCLVLNQHHHKCDIWILNPNILLVQINMICKKSQINNPLHTNGF